MSTHIGKTRKWSARCSCGWRRGSLTRKSQAKEDRDYHEHYCPENGDAWITDSEL